MEGHDIDIVDLERSGRQLGLTLKDIAQVIGADKSTLYHWHTGASLPPSVVRVRFGQFVELVAMLRRVFDGPDMAARWLQDARPASLGGQTTPLEVMRQGRIDRVVLLLETLAAGGQAS